MKMKDIVVHFLLFFTVAANEDEIKYTTKYDNLDIDAIINSERLLINYVNCLLEKGPCTPEGLELRKNMPDAIQSDCNKCSDKQKEITSKLIGFLTDKKPEYWNLLQEKYDQDGAYTKKYMEWRQETNDNQKENSSKIH